jgi:hypothetical protein
VNTRLATNRENNPAMNSWSNIEQLRVFPVQKRIGYALTARITNVDRPA